MENEGYLRSWGINPPKNVVTTVLSAQNGSEMTGLQYCSPAYAYFNEHFIFQRGKMNQYGYSQSPTDAWFP